MTPENKKPPKTSTERWQEWKARQPAGEIILPVAIDHALVELLIDAGEVDERASTDRKRLAEAVRRTLTNALAAKLGR